METPYLDSMIKTLQADLNEDAIWKWDEEKLQEYKAIKEAINTQQPTQPTELSIGAVVERLVAFQNFLILDGQLDIDPDEVEKNAIAFTKAT